MHGPHESAEQIRRRRAASVKWTQYDRDVIPAWVADMDFRPPVSVANSLRYLVDAGDLGYPSQILGDRYREAYAGWSRSHFGFGLQGLILLPDVVTGLFLAMRTLVDKGSSVALLTPSYPPFYASIRENGLRVAAVPLAATPDGFEIDFDLLESTFAKREVTAFILCSPHNPTGRVWSRRELEQISQLAQAHGVQVVSDEIHQDIRYSGYSHVPFNSLDTEGSEHSVVISAATKTFNLAGLKVAHMHTNSASIRERLLSFPEHLRGQATGIGLIAAATAYESGNTWLREVLDTLETNRARITEWIASTSGLKGFAPNATYLYWLEFPFEDPAARTLQECGVALSPGTDYDLGARSFARLNFATYPDVLEEILAGLEKLVG